MGMESLGRYLAVFLLRAAATTVGLATIGAVVAVMRGQSTFYWITSLLIYGGIALFFVIGIAGGTTAGPTVWAGRWRTRGMVDIKRRPITPLVMLIPILPIGLGILLRGGA
jgi:hypothetical protein